MFVVPRPNLAHDLEDRIMDAKTFKDAEADLDASMDAAVGNHEPVIVTREGKPAVVIMSLADWNGWQETVHLMRNPTAYQQLKDSIAQAERGELVEKDLTLLKRLGEITAPTAAE